MKFDEFPCESAIIRLKFYVFLALKYDLRFSAI